MARLKRLEMANASLREEVARLTADAAPQPELSPAPSSAMLQQLKERVSHLEQKDNKKVNVAGFSFGGVADCRHFLNTKMVFDSESSGLFGTDVVSIVDGVSTEGGESLPTDVLRRDEYATKAGFDNIMAAKLYSSIQRPIPIPLAGKGNHPSPAISTFAKWDKQDGMRGLRYEITRGVDHKVNQTTEWIRAQLKHHPEAVLVFTTLVLDSNQHWVAISTFLTNQRGICMQQSDDEAEAWVYPCEVIKGVFMELHHVLSVGAMRSKLG
ncbi:unnamed protein product [Cylindrotheca closterium]|uniref:Uncharacterized protein n=1 Tax=Cylindrotheca closterium TaxID=2856 RepID=A0AAD2G9B6_9STRA|nr:unnamed protein product [Cylindrotheca closterium]